MVELAAKAHALGFQPILQHFGEIGAGIHRIAHPKIDEDAGDFAVLAAQVDSGDEVGAVFLGGGPCGFAVGRGF